ncbi:NADPH-adrenodoxin reductase [Lachancea thermotolerans CBS 6340]|uniref:NADPH:adrenodoxin oxidoreductase, mitochondrial n=1 Tax=Lachancea thermotolerans (strain ATCC 56472 / CBS 6340 / NRRL Y-8284) TaxID=559295 RepID=C5DJE0_LACTC|nr:KLTH0F15664p [Lachancea thermotolerans CBS 6340]CAR24429.1 KLTH0F15664p [Lachancea thermotolerans CBS 6340]
MLRTSFGSRLLSTSRKSVSVVGSGPSGFYTVCRLLAKSKESLDVTLWEKLPVPFGLSRYGVAPDHPEVKNCEDTFTRCAEEFQTENAAGHKFRFIGNVDIGKDIKLKQLLDCQNAVILSYGCGGDHKLNIPGEDTTNGVFTSREVVSWYNGHPSFAGNEKLNNFDWSRVKRVGIIGNGNVALDLARILLSNQVSEIWAQTDINPLALEKLRTAPIEEVKLIARRDFLHSKFTNKEFRELWELERFGIRGVIRPEFLNLHKLGEASSDRVLKRRIEMITEYMLPFDQRTKKNYKKHRPPEHGLNRQWEMDYLKTPIKVNCNAAGKLNSLTVCDNKMTVDNRVELLSNQTQDYELDVLITSLGYGSNPLDEFKSLDIGFVRNHVANSRGAVLNTENEVIPGLYAAGWIRKGSSGVIASTMADAFEVADTVLQELSTFQPRKNSAIDVAHHTFTTWNDWLKLDAEERRRGREQGKPREKFLSADEMLEFLNKK